MGIIDSHVASGRAYSLNQSACNIKITMGQRGAKHCDEDALIFKAIGGHIHEIWASDYRA